MHTQIDFLREQLARHLATHGSDDPQVEHLRWQIVSLERQARWQRPPVVGEPGSAPRSGRAGLPARSR